MAERAIETIGDESLEGWEYLDAGGFAMVCTAKHKDLGIEVIVKLLHNDDDSASYAALLREAEYMEAADDRYVPKVYGMYQGCPPILGRKKTTGVVLELMEGGSLQAFLKTLSKPPPWPLAFRLAHQVAVAMDYLHREKDLVHKDLKPDNILLDAKLNVKIGDFGLCTVSNSVCSTKGENKGRTVAFTPPEAFERTYRRVRSFDIFSYGIVLWTILTGESPYPGVAPYLLPHRIKKGDRPNLRQIDVRQAYGLKDLVDLMKRCWHANPKKRPSSEECVEVTSRVFSMHEERIAAADRAFMLPVPPSTHEERIAAAVSAFKPPAPPVPPGCTERAIFLEHAVPLSWDPNTANWMLILSEDNMKVTQTDQPQSYARHPQRFTSSAQVLSTESVSDGYFEVEGSGYFVDIAVSYKPIDKAGLSSGFGQNVQSWALECWGPDYAKRYTFTHNSIGTVLSVPVPSRGRNRLGVYVDSTGNMLRFYHVRGNTMRLLHTERTTFTGPLYAGIYLYYGGATAELCKI